MEVARRAPSAADTAGGEREAASRSRSVMVKAIAVGCRDGRRGLRGGIQDEKGDGGGDERGGVGGGIHVEQGDGRDDEGSAAGEGKWV